MDVLDQPEEDPLQIFLTAIADRILQSADPEGTAAHVLWIVSQDEEPRKGERLFTSRLKGIANFNDEHFNRMAQAITADIDPDTFVDGLAAYISFTREYPYKLSIPPAPLDPNKRWVRRDLVPHDAHGNPDWLAIQRIADDPHLINSLLETVATRKAAQFYWYDPDLDRWHWWWSPAYLGERPVDHIFYEEQQKDDDYPW